MTALQKVKEAEALFDQASELADEAEQLGSQAILKNHAIVKEYVHAMGELFFVVEVPMSDGASKQLHVGGGRGEDIVLLDDYEAGKDGFGDDEILTKDGAHQLEKAVAAIEEFEATIIEPLTEMRLL